jgi:serine-type D-Ala-D-Ala carboxypeptidase (penicillin-binding protein 5/6)
MNRTVLAFGFALLTFGITCAPRATAQLSEGRRSSVAINAAAWVIADATTGAVLDSANANRRLQIGSITKVATAMVVLDWAAASGADLGQFATVPASIGTLSSPNSIGLQPGDQISLRDALYASLMQSDNQAAETIAVHVGRELGGGASDREAAAYFTAQLNALARKLGMRETRFLNAHGLDDLESKAPYSTAADVAKLTSYALGHSGFTFYTSQKERRITWRTASTEPNSFLLRNTNELLGQENIDGVKTGNTRKAGPCVVISAAQRPESRLVGEQHMITPRRIAVVVLGSANRFEVARALLLRGWNLFDQWTAAGRPTKGWKPGVATP